MVWKPDVTVAALAERDGRFLLVEEHTERGLLFNQPAGHLEAGESIRALDTGIVRAVWLSPDEIRASRQRHRSPLVVRCMEDYLAGVRAPLGLLVDYD